MTKTPKQRKVAGATIEKLKAWRKANGLSQAQAAVMMRERGLPLSNRTLQAWEGGYRRPDSWKTKMLEEFLKANPVVKDRPKFGKRVLEDGEVSEIRKLRAGGEELENIAQRFGITGSAVSRICRGSRHSGKRGSRSSVTGQT